MRMQIEALEYRTMLAGVVTQPIASFFKPNFSPSFADSFGQAKSIPSPLLAAIHFYEATKSKGTAPTTPASTTSPEVAPTTPITTSPVSPTSSASDPNNNGGIVRSPINTPSASLSTKGPAGASLQSLAGGVASPALQHGPTFTTQLDTGFEPTPDATDVPQDSYSTGNLVGQNGWMDEPGESDTSTATVESDTVDSGTQAVELDSEGSGSQDYADFNTTDSTLTASQISAGGGDVDVTFAMMHPVLTAGQTRSAGFGIDIFSADHDQVIASLYEVQDPSGRLELEVTDGSNTVGNVVSGDAGNAPADGVWGTYHIEMDFNNNTFTVFVDGNTHISSQFFLNRFAVNEGGIGAVELATTADGNDSAYFDNLTETITSPAGNQLPTQFSNLTASESISYGMPSVAFSGTISTATFIPPATELVAITLNGTTTNALIDNQGNFSATFDTSQLPASATPYAVTYSYAGDSNFASLLDRRTTTLTVNATIPTWMSPTSSATWDSFSQTLTVSGPTTINADPASDEPIIQASGSAAQLTINPASGSQIHIGGLSLTDGASATIASLGLARTASNYRVLVIGVPGATVAPTFTIDSTSTLDVTDNDVVDLYGSGTSPYITIRGEIEQAYDGGKWDLPGLTSSGAQANPTTYGIGYAEAAALGLSSFDGVTLGGNAVLMKYTLLGDTTLKGTVGLGDYNTVIADFNTNQDWTGGSFHYSGSVGLGDYNAILGNFNKSVGVSLGISAALSDDTGVSDTDGITSDPSIAGQLADASPVGFQAGFDSAASSSYVSVLSDVQSNGTFALTPSQLAQINGGPLADGPHTLHLQELNASGEVIASQDVSFTLDTTAPTSSVTSLPAQETSSNFTVNWSGTDGAAGSGIANYSVFVSVNGLPYTIWQQATTATSAVYNGQGGSSDSFYSVATDIAGNVQPTPTSAQASTTVAGLPAWLNPNSVATWNASSHILTVTGATTVIADPASDEPIIEASGAAAVVSLNSNGTDIHIGGLSLTNGASATVTSLGSARSVTNYRLLVIGVSGATGAPMYNIDSTSTLDLADNDMAILYGSGTSPLSNVSSEISQAYDSKLWDKPGLTSSVAKTMGGVTALGFGEASTLGMTSFDGLTLGGNAVLVKYTLVGDANLDGSVNLADYNTVVDNLNNSGTWTSGSFDYSGTVSLGDYNTVISNFNQTLANVLPSSGSPPPAA